MISTEERQIIKKALSDGVLDFDFTPDQRDFSYQKWGRGGTGWHQLQEGGTGIMKVLLFHDNVVNPGSKEWRPSKILKSILEYIKKNKVNDYDLVVGTKIRIGKAYAATGQLEEGTVIELVEGTFEEENGLYAFTSIAPAIWNEEANEYDSIYHLFGNNLEDFKDCEIIKD